MLTQEQQKEITNNIIKFSMLVAITKNSKKLIQQSFNYRDYEGARERTLTLINKLAEDFRNDLTHYLDIKFNFHCKHTTIKRYEFRELYKSVKSKVLKETFKELIQYLNNLEQEAVA